MAINSPEPRDAFVGEGGDGTDPELPEVTENGRRVVADLEDDVEATPSGEEEQE